MAFDPDKFLAETGAAQQPQASGFDPDKFLAETSKPQYSVPQQSLEALLRGVSPIPVDFEKLAYEQNMQPVRDEQGRPMPAPGPSPSLNLNQVRPDPQAEAAAAKVRAEREAFQKQNPGLAYGLEYGPSAVSLASGGAKLAGKGLKKGADMLMQKAVGMKKSIPGAGSELIEQGVRGTKEGMLAKAEKAFPKVEAQAQEVMESVGPSAVAPENVSAYLFKEAQKLVGPDGSIAPTDLEKYNSLMSRAGQILDESPKSLQSTRFLRSQLQKGSRAKSGEAKSALEAQLAQAEAKARTMGLERTLAEESPEALAKWRQSMETERALLEAQKALKKPESLSSMIKPVETLIGGTVGGAPGAMAGWALAQPATQSYLATGAHKLSKPLSAFGNAVPATTRVLPAEQTLEALLLGDPKKEKPKKKK